MASHPLTEPLRSSLVLFICVACGASTTPSGAHVPNTTVAPPFSSPTPPSPPPSQQSTPPKRESPVCGTPDGTPADYIPPELPGFTISAPVTCEGEQGAYIRIERTSGSRKIGIARGASGGFDEGCLKPPASAKDCPILNWEVPTLAAEQVLESQAIATRGHGAGPCADLEGPFAAWNASILLTSWSDAAMVLRLLADQMKKYDVAGYLGVSVVRKPCFRLM